MPRTKQPQPVKGSEVIEIVLWLRLAGNGRKVLHHEARRVTDSDQKRVVLEMIETAKVRFL